MTPGVDHETRAQPALSVACMVEPGKLWNPYLRLIGGALGEAGVRYRGGIGFLWFGDYSLVHVHWPEAMADAGVAFWDPVDTMCSPTVCSPVREGALLYGDSGHLSRAGALSLAGGIAPALDWAAGRTAARPGL